jgi:hypothetical protein
MEVYAIDLRDKTINPAAQFGDLASLLNIILPLLTLGGALLFLAMILYGAFSYLTAGDKPDNLQKAQKTIKFSVFGFAIVVLAYLFIKLIGFIFGINLPL